MSAQDLKQAMIRKQREQRAKTIAAAVKRFAANKKPKDKNNERP